MDTHTEADSRALVQSTERPKPQTLNPKPVDNHTEADSRALVQSTERPKPQTLNPKPVDTHTEADSRALVQSTVPLLTFWFWINLCVYAESIKLQRTQSPVRHIPKREMRYTRFRLKAKPRARVVGMFGWMLRLARKSPPGLGFRV